MHNKVITSLKFYTEAMIKLNVAGEKVSYWHTAVYGIQDDRQTRTQRGLKRTCFLAPLTPRNATVKMSLP